MNTLFVLVLLLGFALYLTNSELSYQQRFSKWQTKHGISFTKAQTPYRLKIYKANLDAIDQHNRDPTQTYQKGQNKFSCFTHQEFVSIMLRPLPSSSTIVVQNSFTPASTVSPSLTIAATSSSSASSSSTSSLINITAVNWTSTGYTSPVKDQGNCGSCWAFATTGAIESAYLIQSNKSIVLSLSEQQLVDCTVSYGNYGCSGGWPYIAMNYIIKAKGITTQSLYPYTAVNGTCKKSFSVSYPITSYKNITGCSSLITQLYSRPIAVLIDATNWGTYARGLFTNCSSNVTINHVVLLTGVFTNSTWYLKNQWGTSWGQSGYMLLSPGNSCGICLQAGVSPYY